MQKTAPTIDRKMVVQKLLSQLGGGSYLEIGVELGQLAIILFMYFAIAKWFRNKQWYRARIVMPLSAMIAVIALYWTIERVFYS